MRTLARVPHNVVVTGADEESAEGALNHLLAQSRRNSP